MSLKSQEVFPIVPDKQYFSIGEVSILCSVKAHVLRYWESEFHQLKPLKRKGNRRYYKKQEVLLVRKIRKLLYDEGYTISGAKLRLSNESLQDKTQELDEISLNLDSKKNSSGRFANSVFFLDNKRDPNTINVLSEILEILQGSQDKN
jgi:DNA-binding transcriptional MerR regulator